MTHPLTVYIIFIVLLLLFSAFFSASEAALFSLGRLELDRLREVKSRVANMITSLLDKPRELITTIFLANEIVNSAIAILFASVFYYLMGDERRHLATVLSIAFGTVIILFFGEVLPKAMAIRNSDTFSVICSGPVSFFSSLVAPLRIAITKVADGIIYLFGSNPPSDAGIVREEELRLLVETGEMEGVLGPVEEEMIQNILSFGERTISEAMTPKEKIFSLSYDLSWDEILARIREKRFGRIPLYKENSDNIVGVLYIKDLLKKEILIPDGPRRRVSEVMRKPFFVPPKKKLGELFKEFQAGRIHMALVVNEFGTVVGLITMKDLLNEFFG